LIDLEVKPHVIGPSINVILAQRLVRKLCPHCRKKAELSGEYADKIAKFISSLPKNIKLPEAELYEPVGCSVCIDGYKGRTGIFEVFEIDKDIERLIHEESSEVDIESKIVEKGFVNMQRDGIIKALAGTTSLAEVERATGPLDW
jgi:type IV pilus assembly protein PilB